jgi:hypothetical protein
MNLQENDIFQHVAPSSLSLASTSTTLSSLGQAGNANAPNNSPDLIQWFANNFEHIVEVLRHLSQLSTTISTTIVSIEMLRHEFPVFGSVLDLLLDVAFSLAYFDFNFTWNAVQNPDRMATLVHEATGIVLLVHPGPVEPGKHTILESSVRNTHQIQGLCSTSVLLSHRSKT